MLYVINKYIPTYWMKHRLLCVNPDSWFSGETRAPRGQSCKFDCQACWVVCAEKLYPISTQLLSCTLMQRKTWSRLSMAICRNQKKKKERKEKRMVLWAAKWRNPGNKAEVKVYSNIWQETKYRYAWHLERSFLHSTVHTGKTHPFPSIPTCVLYDSSTYTDTSL